MRYNALNIRQGDRYGRLIIIREVERRNGRRYFLCHCDCGNERIIPLGTMRQGKATSCGCYKIEKSSTHGETHTRLYHIWKTMKQRCNYEKHINFKDYGGRGITICEDWSDFVNFRDWALSNGYRDNLTIERLDVNGNYEPDNCTWATVKMPFGKYKGEPISDLPDNYKQWMLDKFEWHAGNYNLREAIIMNM